MGSMINREIAQRYLVRERLGAGAHGVVYRAWDGVRKGDVALKLYNEDGLDVQTAEAARHFEVVDGSAILPLLEVHPEFAEGQVTIMPLMPSTMDGSEPVFVSRALLVARRVLTALEFCHGRDVLHGDIKPTNMFVSPNDAILLGDFGVAQTTVEYSAPELLQTGSKSVQTDLWATAVSLYELICGETPFGSRPDSSEAEIADRIVSINYCPPDDLLPFLPLRYRSFFRDCFAVDPADRRFATAGSMRSALAQLSARVEWIRVGTTDKVVCYEGHALTPDGYRNGTAYQASISEDRNERYTAQVSKKQPNGRMRRLHRLAPVSGSRARCGQKLKVWMRALTETGSIPR